MNEFFFNCDWGTSRLRLRLINRATGEIVAQRSSEEGAVKLIVPPGSDRGALFRGVLERNAAEVATSVNFNLDSVPVMISGMASSSIGWQELPYAKIPFSLEGTDLQWVSLNQNSARPVFLFSGVCSDVDVMRGEEMELIGLAALLTERQQLPAHYTAILPGTHSKHVQVRNNVIVDFQTYMTGELFDLLWRQSSLRHPKWDGSFTAPAGEGWQQSFAEGVDLSTKNNVTSSIFYVRTRQLLRKYDHNQSAALLSGILIGSELQHLASRGDSSEAIVLAASPELSVPYHQASNQLNLADRTIVIPPEDVSKLSAIGQQRVLKNLIR